MLLSDEACGRNTALFKLLIDKGAVNINCKDDKEVTPLHFSMRNSNKEMALILLERPSINVMAQNKGGQTALHFLMASTPFVESTVILLMQKLIQKNPEILEVKDLKGKTALDIAKEKNKSISIQIILNSKNLIAEKEKLSVLLKGSLSEWRDYLNSNAFQDLEKKLQDIKKSIASFDTQLQTLERKSRGTTLDFQSEKELLAQLKNCAEQLETIAEKKKLSTSLKSSLSEWKAYLNSNAFQDLEKKLQDIKKSIASFDTQLQTLERKSRGTTLDFQSEKELLAQLKNCAEQLDIQKRRQASGTSSQDGRKFETNRSNIFNLDLKDIPSNIESIFKKVFNEMSLHDYEALASTADVDQKAMEKLSGFLKEELRKLNDSFSFEKSLGKIQRLFHPDKLVSFDETIQKKGEILARLINQIKARQK